MGQIITPLLVVVDSVDSEFQCCLGQVFGLRVIDLKLSRSG
jgi:hypothetical protein